MSYFLAIGCHLLNVVHIMVAVWLSANMLVLIDEVTLCRAWLVLGWVLQMGKPSRYVTSRPGQLSLAVRPWVGAMSTSESWGVNRRTTQYTSPVSVVSHCKLVSG